MTKPKIDTIFRYKPQGDTLREFHRSGEDYRILIGPLGSGKTQACISEILHQIDTQTPDVNKIRPSRWAVVRNTYRDLENTTIKDFREIVEEMQLGRLVMSSPPRWECKYKRPDHTIVEAEIIFIALDVPSDEKKARGLQLTGVWINEMKEMTRNNCDMLFSRVTRYPPKKRVRKGKFARIADSNAPDRDHWLAKLCKEEKPEGWWFGVQPPGVIKQGNVWVTNKKAENGNNLNDRYYSGLIAGRKESWIRKNLANEFMFHADGRPVHPDFNEIYHVSAFELEPTPNRILSIGVDFGRTPAAAIMQRQANGQWYILAEIVTTNCSAKKMGKHIKRQLNTDYNGYEIECTGDPAGDDMAQTRDETPIDMLNLANLDCVPAHTNDFEERITVLDDLLTSMIDGQPAIMVSPKCVTVIKGLSGAYQYKRIQVAGDDRFHDKPKKSPESHVCEAIHYGLMGAGEGESMFTGSFSQYDEVDSWAPPASQFE